MTLGTGSGAPEAAATGTEKDAPEGYPTIEGERGVPSVNRVRSLQSRVSSILAVALMSSLGLGLLTWYYATALGRSNRVHQAAQSASRARAQGEMALPSLGRIEPPVVRSPRPDPQTVEPSALQRVLGPAPPPASFDGAPAPGEPSGANPYPPAAYAGQSVKSAGELAFERRLSGPVFAKVSTGGAAAGEGTDPASQAEGPGSAPLTQTSVLDAPPYAVAAHRGTADESAGGLERLLEPSPTPAVRARILPTRRFLLPKGAFIDCTLETAIDSTYPGLTTCVTATDTFSADGTVVLLERGTKLVGETQGEVIQGASRVFVLWSEARTPTGVVVPLSSPGTDELGRSGLPGQVDRHFWDRFGAAILITVIDAGAQAAAQSTAPRNGTVIVNPTASTDITTEALKGTLAIAPTVRKAQGDRIQVLVARDIDFRSVYELKTASAASGAASPGATP
ncbi:MAG TPA: type IV secretion system protein VirB10 [Steroidobacteraceae bacterium]|nr:type IV secretion system protein VirB10 [Steroidobacteraceae bacterium]